MDFEKPINNKNEKEDFEKAEDMNNLEKPSDKDNDKDNDISKKEKQKEIDELKKEDYEYSQEKLRETRESIESAEFKGEKIEGFDEAYDVIEKEIDNILSNKEKALVSVAGKSGSGKTFFSEELKNRLVEKSKSSTLISTDNFYKEHESIEEKEVDTDKLQAEIKKMQEQFDVVLVEGLQTIDSSILGQKPDFKTLVESNFEERLATKIDRDSKTFRSAEDSLDLVVKAFVHSPEIGEKFEGNINKGDVDLEIENKYKNPSKPELYIKNNELVFSSSGEVKKRQLNEEEMEGLKKAGIKSL